MDDLVQLGSTVEIVLGLEPERDGCNGVEVMPLSRIVCWPGLSCIHSGEGLPGRSIGGSRVALTCCVLCAVYKVVSMCGNPGSESYAVLGSESWALLTQMWKFELQAYSSCC